MLQDSVVALIPEDKVGSVLPAVHRSGYGHLARMIRSGKRAVLDQLQRAGVPVTQAPEALAGIPAVLLVTAAARTPMAAALLLREGASRVWTVSANGIWAELEDAVLAQPNVHVLPPRPVRPTGPVTFPLGPDDASTGGEHPG